MLDAKELEFIWTQREVDRTEVERDVIKCLNGSSIDRRTLKARLRHHASSMVDKALYYLGASGVIISTDTVPKFYALNGQKLGYRVKGLIKARSGKGLEVLKFIETGPKTIVDIRKFLNEGIEPGKENSITVVNSIMYRLTGKMNGHAEQVTRKEGIYRIKGE